MSKNRTLADFISTSSVSAEEIANGAVTVVKLANTTSSNGTSLIQMSGHSTALNITPSGRIGIDTNDPNQKLHVHDSSTNATHIRTTNSNGDIFYGIDGNGAGYAWMNSGAGDFYVGTNGAGNLIAYAGSAERMRIGNTGDVGIGDSALSNGNSHNRFVRISNTGSGARSALEIEGNSPNAHSGIWFKNNGTNANVIASRGAGDLTFLYGASSTEAMRITSAGKVGIGTSDISDARLSLNGSGSNGYNALQIRSSDSNGGVKGGVISFAQYDDASTSWTNLGGWDTGSNRIIYLGGGNWGPQEATEFRVYTGSYDAGSGNAQQRLIVNSTGNVGIGTTSPAGKLEVENTSVNYAILGTSNNGHYFESQSDDNTDGFEIYQQHGSTTTRNSFIVNDNRTGSNIASFLVIVDGIVCIGKTKPSAQLEISSSAPTFILNANSQATGKKKVRLASSQFTAGDFVIQSMADNGTTVNSTPFKIDTDGYTIPAEFKPDKYRQVLGPSTITGTFVSGAATNTWHSITNVDFNAYLGAYNQGYRGVIVAIFWTSGSVTLGYNHNAQVYIPASSSNTYSSYSSGNYSSFNIGGTFSDELPVTVHHHTSVTSTHEVRMRLRNSTGVNYDPLRLEIFSTASVNSSNAYITVWRA